MSESEPSRTVATLLAWGTSELAAAGIGEAALEAALLLGFCLDKSRTELYLAAREPVAAAPEEQFQALLARRREREPLAYIVAEREFWSLPFFVSPAVLIPRPETEFLLEVVLARRNRARAACRCLDLCCGSGVIAVVLAKELGLPVIALDISAAALAVARKNCIRHGLQGRVSLVRADLLRCFIPESPFSLIVSNPPYVSRAEIAHDLEPEVSRFEPHLALDGGESGLDTIEAIRDQLPAMLSPGGDCFLEIGDRQGAAVRSLFRDRPGADAYRFVQILKDYAGRDRVAHIRRT